MTGHLKEHPVSTRLLWTAPDEKIDPVPWIKAIHDPGYVAVMKNIRQNLFFAFAYNALGIPVAAGVLCPLTGTLLSPMIAGAAMGVSSLSVILNALRLRKTI